jgi:hypothetical protein
MKTEEFLLLAEVDYWREMIDSRESISSPMTLAEMKRSLVFANYRLARLRGEPDLTNHLQIASVSDY